MHTSCFEDMLVRKPHTCVANLLSSSSSFLLEFEFGPVSWADTPPPGQTHHPWSDPPGSHPSGQTPLDRHPWGDTPPSRQTPHPWADTPHPLPLERRILQRTVRILLECILVYTNFWRGTQTGAWSMHMKILDQCRITYTHWSETRTQARNSILN